MKFINLLKKEISELVNVHMIATLGIMLLIFMIMGNLMTSAIDDVVEDVSHPIINISDCDDTDLTHQLIEALKSSKAEVNEFTVSGEDYAQMLKSNDIKNLVVIPDGFTDDINNVYFRSNCISYIIVQENHHLYFSILAHFFNYFYFVFFI